MNSLGGRSAPGRRFWIIPVLILFLTLSPIAAFVAEAILAARTGGLTGMGSLIPALRFSLSQASMSMVLSVALGLPGAFLVAKYRFPGRKLFFSLSVVPFCLPPIMVILAFILYYGRNGWFTRLATALGINGGEYGGVLYSFWGLVLIHAFYNFPIVVHHVGSLWSRLPSSREEAARTLGASRLRAFSTGTLPFILPALLQSASLIFLFCFFSFTIVLVFGGLSGSTLEVGIYRALRFTNNKPAALAYALVQTLVAVSVVLVFSYFSRRTSTLARGFGEAAPRRRPTTGIWLVIAGYFTFIIIFFLGPLASLAVEAFLVKSSMASTARFGFDNFMKLLAGPRSILLSATRQSLVIGITATIAATALGVIYAASSAGKTPSGSGSSLKSMGAILPLAVSPALLAAGWNSLMPFSGVVLIMIAETALVWPFIARSIESALGALDPEKHQAALTLGASSLRATVNVDLPSIFPSLASAMAFAFSMTMGDANIPLLLGDGKSETLPLLMYRLTSAYRFNEACAVALVLALFTSAAFFLKEKSHELF